MREIMDQYKGLQEELDMRREECLLLAGEGASLIGGEPESEELFLAYETQKNVIQQLQTSLAQEREQRDRVRAQDRTSADHTGKHSSAQQLLQNNMKRNPASQTEPIMQHEITRLTGQETEEAAQALPEEARRIRRLAFLSLFGLHVK
jgi:hypothetical protein